MERRKRPYSIQKRPAVNHRRVYYAKFRDGSRNYLTEVSTGCTRIDDAVRWCEEHLGEAAKNKENITLAEYAKRFWEPKAPFVTDRTEARGCPGPGPTRSSWRAPARRSRTSTDPAGTSRPLVVRMLMASPRGIAAERRKAHHQSSRRIRHHRERLRPSACRRRRPPACGGP